MNTIEDNQLRGLMDEIRDDLSSIRHLTGRPAPGKKILEAMQKVPREEFVPYELQRSAYANCPLPIGYGQTISQPSVVALMTDLITPKPKDVVLEIGTGSGYQAAILAELVGHVYTMEIVAALAEQARQRLQRLAYANVEVRVGDGSHGWPEHAPFDAIVVTAAAASIPPALIDQLKQGGKLVIPVGTRYFGQELLEVTKGMNGTIKKRSVLPVSFVPLVESGENAPHYFVHG